MSSNVIHLFPGGALGATLSLVALLIFLANKYAQQIDHDEPPLAVDSLPLLGHVVGLYRKKAEFYVELSKKMKEGIFTVLVPGQKMYIVTSTKLIQTIQKEHKTLAFPPIQIKFTERLFDPSPEAKLALSRGIEGERSPFEISVLGINAMKEALYPGRGLDAMNNVMVQRLAVFVEELHLKEPRQVSLKDWVMKYVTIATTDAVFGPQNPYQDQSIRDAFWDFDSDVTTLIVGFLPTILASKGVGGRSRVAKAFQEYFQKDGHQDASMLLQNRYNNGIKFFSLSDLAKFEVGNTMAVLLNTVPSCFWMLYHIYSDPELLDSIRKEIEPSIDSRKGRHNTVRTINISSLKGNCPLLASTFQEVLRFRTIGTSVREVMHDMMLQDRWLLKKGSMIQMPARAIHMDESVWGPDVDTFKARRFMASEKLGKKVNPVAFRAFGGGTTLCPGRHFATNEVLALVAMFVMRFNIEPSHGQGWDIPPLKSANVAAVLMEPGEVKVDFSVRSEAEQVVWEYKIEPSEKIFALTAEDKGES